MDFEWDDDKRERKLDKHVIDFVRAVKVFENPIVEWIDDWKDYGEDRLMTIGHWKEQFLIVVSTWRGNRRRIISA